MRKSAFLLVLLLLFTTVTPTFLTHIVWAAEDSWITLEPMPTARRTLQLYYENLEYIQVRRHIYEKAKVAIDDLNLPFMTVDDFVEEQIKTLNEQHDQWKEQKEEAER